MSAERVSKFAGVLHPTPRTLVAVRANARQRAVLTGWWHAVSAALIAVSAVIIARDASSLNREGIVYLILMTVASYFFAALIDAIRRSTGLLSIATLSFAFWGLTALQFSLLQMLAAFAPDTSRAFLVPLIAYCLLLARLGIYVHLRTACLLISLLSALALLMPEAGLQPLPMPARTERLMRTARGIIDVTYQRGPVGLRTDNGGALTRMGEDMLLATENGELYRVSLTTDGAVQTTRIVAPPLFDRAMLRHDVPGVAVLPRLRVTGLAVDTTRNSVFVSFLDWHHEAGCLSISVASGKLKRGATDSVAGWTRLFDSDPCLPYVQPFDDILAGGKLIVGGPNRLFLSTGDMSVEDVDTDRAQDPRSNYGKVISLDTLGEAAMFSRGHRNPQGLLLDRAGQLWETEHGPRGGDELNLLARGRNYGWPLATYGTSYGRFAWQRVPQQQHHAPFTEPAFAFVPAIAISALLQVRPGTFDGWDDDLLVSSLGGRSLYRIRLNGNRVMFVEPIPIERRIRDLAQAADGRIVLWTDNGEFGVISPARLAAGDIRTSPLLESSSRRP